LNGKRIVITVLDKRESKKNIRNGQTSGTCNCGW